MTPSERAKHAAVLGVPDSASPEQIRQAWRAWAQLLHPDHGGDDQTFIRVREAYDALMQDLINPATPAQMAQARSHPCFVPPDEAVRDAPVDDARTPRPRLRDVLVAPRDPFILSVLIGVALAAAALPAMSGLAVVSAMPAALLSGLAAVLLAYRCTSESADAGHRVVVAAVSWVTVTAAQLLVSTLAGTSLLPVLPLLALPLVAFTSWVLFPGWPLRRTRR